MESPDEAVRLSDVQLADANNREWLLASSRSSRLSTDLSRYQLDWSRSLSLSQHRRTQTDELCAPAIRRAQQAKDATDGSDLFESNKGRTSAWLLQQEQTSNLSYQLYDNITFADSPPLLRSLSSAKSAAPADPAKGEKSPLLADRPADRPGNCCLGNYRIFLACYLLLGITLATYSRNALSLVAVGMVANNQLNSELVAILSQVSSNSSAAGGSLASEAADGSCPIWRPSEGQPVAEWSGANGRLAAQAIARLAGGLDWPQTSRFQIETALRSSVEQRVQLGLLVDWSPSQQGLIFAAGSVGNLLIAIPLARLGELRGPKWVIFVALAAATCQAALMPLASVQPVWLVVLFQLVFNGLSYGADCVAYTLFVRWLTASELAFFVACLVICYQLGTIMSSSISTALLSESVHWSWCFYAPALLCGLWTAGWALVGASEPDQSALVSRSELLYLRRHSKMSQTIAEANKATPEGHQGGQPVSWLKLARDPNIWALVGVKFTLRWYFSAYASLMPTYLSSVVHMSVETIGHMSVAQSLVGLFSGLLMGYLAKSAVLRRPLGVSLGAFRRGAQAVVNFGLALSLAVFVVFDCSQWVSVLALTVGSVCLNFYVAGALQLPLDLSAEHCGLITSVTNTLALGQALGAPISGLLLNGAPKSRSLWRIVWSAAILLNLLSGILFVLLVDAKPKNYAKDRQADREAAATAAK